MQDGPNCWALEEAESTAYAGVAGSETEDSPSLLPILLGVQMPATASGCVWILANLNTGPHADKTSTLTYGVTSVALGTRMLRRTIL